MSESCAVESSFDMTARDHAEVIDGKVGRKWWCSTWGNSTKCCSLGGSFSVVKLYLLLVSLDCWLCQAHRMVAPICLCLAFRTKRSMYFGMLPGPMALPSVKLVKQALCSTLLSACRIQVTFVDKNGEEQQIRVPVGVNMLQAAHDNDIELEGEFHIPD